MDGAAAGTDHGRHEHSDDHSRRAAGPQLRRAPRRAARLRLDRGVHRVARLLGARRRLRVRRPAVRVPRHDVQPRGLGVLDRGRRHVRGRARRAAGAGARSGAPPPAARPDVGGRGGARRARDRRARGRRPPLQRARRDRAERLERSGGAGHGAIRRRTPSGRPSASTPSSRRVDCCSPGPPAAPPGRRRSARGAPPPTPRFRGRSPAWAAYAACAWAVAYAIGVRGYQGLGGTLGLPGTFEDPDGMRQASLLAGAGILLVGVGELALVRPWGLRLPRWLVIVPALAGSAYAAAHALTAYVTKPLHLLGVIDLEFRGWARARRGRPDPLGPAVLRAVVPRARHARHARDAAPLPPHRRLT